MLYLSHSRLDVYRKCHRQFWYEFIKELPKEDENKEASDFGSCCHEILEKYTGGSKQELMELYKSMVPTKYPITSKYKKKIPLALKNIHMYYKTILRKYPSAFKEKQIRIKYNVGVILTGKIDLIIEQDDGIYLVVDYKTKKTYKFSKPEEQMSMYALLLDRDKQIPLEKIRCEMVYIALDGEDKYGNIILNEGYENIVKPCRVKPTDVESLKKEIETLQIRVEKYTEEKDWLTSPTKFNCTYCPYNKSCEDSLTRDVD